jgi:hypothetical protein
MNKNYFRKTLQIENANAPSFIKTIVDSQADEEQPAEFSVNVKGDPKPNVEWSHNGTVIKEGVNHLVNLITFWKNIIFQLIYRL